MNKSALGAVLPATLFSGAFALCWLGDTLAERTPEATDWATPTTHEGSSNSDTDPGTPVIPISELPLAPGASNITGASRAEAPPDASVCTIPSFVDESGIKRIVKECP